MLIKNRFCLIELLLSSCSMMFSAMIGIIILLCHVLWLLIISHHFLCHCHCCSCHCHRHHCHCVCGDGGVCFIVIIIIISYCCFLCHSQGMLTFYAERATAWEEKLLSIAQLCFPVWSNMWRWVCLLRQPKWFHPLLYMHRWQFVEYWQHTCLCLCKWVENYV